MIRQETATDYTTVYTLIRDAFATAEHADGNEQDIVQALRKSQAFIPELSLVAIEDNKIVGHILFTKAHVGTNLVLALAPLSVLPAYQRRGIGTALIHHGHAIAASLGYAYSFVLGNPDYYTTFGYVPAEPLGIVPPFAVPTENFMCCILQDTVPAITGTLRYAPELCPPEGL